MTFRWISMLGVPAVLWVTPVMGQTCPLPAVDCTGALHCGGEWDFENGFYFTPHYLAGQNASPCGSHAVCDQGLCPGGNISCVEPNRTAHIGTGWSHWASFPTWDTGGFFGFANFNENKNCANVYRGNRSQEITLTCANGVGLIYKQASVPAGHHIKVEAFMKFTPNDARGDWPPTQHDLGLDPTGGTNPLAPSVQWTAWDENISSPPGVNFNRTEETIVSTSSTLTVFIRLTALEPPCDGQTFLIDTVRIYDLGVPGPELSVTPASLTNEAVVGTPAASQTLDVQNVGAGSFSYSVSDDANWLSVTPMNGSSSGEVDTLTVDYDATGLGLGEHTATITVDAGSVADSPQLVDVTLVITTKPADYDNDGDVDLTDYGAFQACFSGIGIGHDPGCDGADFDDDNDVDSQDFSAFMGCLSGHGVESDTGCAP